MKTYTVNRPLYFGGGERKAVGESIELSVQDASRLLMAGSISEPEKKKERKTANKAEGASEKNKSAD